MGQLLLVSYSAWGLLPLGEEEAVVMAEAWNIEELSVYHLVAVLCCNSLEVVLCTASLCIASLCTASLCTASLCTVGNGLVVGHTVEGEVGAGHTVEGEVGVGHIVRFGVGHIVGGGVGVGHTD